MPLEAENIDRASRYIKDRLKNQNDTYEVLGTRYGLTRSDIARIANGQVYEPSFRVICRMSQMLNIPLADLAEMYGMETPKGGRPDDMRLRRLLQAVATLSGDEREFALDMVDSLANTIEKRATKK